MLFDFRLKRYNETSFVLFHFFPSRENKSINYKYLFSIGRTIFGIFTTKNKLKSFEKSINYSQFSFVVQCDFVVESLISRYVQYFNNVDTA